MRKIVLGLIGATVLSTSAFASPVTVGNSAADLNAPASSTDVAAPAPAMKATPAKHHAAAKKHHAHKAAAKKAAANAADAK